MTKAFDLIQALRGRTLAVAESCTGGSLGAELTTVPGSSAVFKGGVISYWSEVKADILGVDANVLETLGPVSGPVAGAMAEGVRKLLHADFSLSVTGLAGPDGDSFGHPVGTVFIGLSREGKTLAREYHFSGDRNAVRKQAVEAALVFLLEEL